MNCIVTRALLVPSVGVARGRFVLHASAQPYHCKATLDVGARATNVDGLIITRQPVVPEDAKIADGTVY